MTEKLDIKKNQSFFFAIIIIFIPIFISRIFYLDVAAGADESMYYLLGQETSKGNIPYSTFYEMKPPFLFFNFALVALFTSGSVFSLHLAALFLSLLNTYLFFYITNKLFNFEKACLSALVFFILLSSPHLCGPYLLGEHFVLFYLLLSLLFLLKTESFKKVNILICGVLFGIAVLTKQTAIFFIPLYLFLLSQYFHQEHYLKKLFWFSLGGLSILIITILYLVLTDSLSEAYYWLFEHSKAYTSKLNMTIAQQAFIYFSKSFISHNLVLVILSITGLILLFIKNSKKEIGVAVIFLASGFIALIPGFRFYMQYWILLIPSVSILASFSLDLESKFKSAKFIILIAIIAHIGLNTENFFPKDKDALLSAIFESQNFKEIKTLSVKLNRIMEKDASLLVLGGIPQPYLYTKKSPHLRHIWTPMINYQNDKCASLRSEFIESFEANPPDYVFFSFNPYHWSFADDSSQEIYNYVFRKANSNYQKIMAIDLNAPNEIVAGNEIFNFTEKENSMIVYKRK